MNIKKDSSFTLETFESASKFTMHPENRRINVRHLGKLKEQVRMNLATIAPIIVNKQTRHVIDGQHRLEAFKAAIRDGLIPQDSKIRVMWVNIPAQDEKMAIINANTHSKPWSINDYVSSHTSAGNLSFLALDEFCRKHELCHKNHYNKKTNETKVSCCYGYAVAMINGKGQLSALKDGSYILSEEDVKHGDEVHNEILQIIELLEGKKYGKTVETCARTWPEYRDMYPFKDWMRVMKLKKARLIKMPKGGQKEWELIFDTVLGEIKKSSKGNQ